MSEVIIYHNSRCSKSRQTLQLLRDHQVEPRIVEYLKEVPTVEGLSALITLLGLSVREVMRTKEEEYKALGLKNVEDDQELLAAMVAHPKLIERPIVIANDKAVLGRPPENILDIL